MRPVRLPRPVRLLRLLAAFGLGTLAALTVPCVLAVPVLGMHPYYVDSGSMRPALAVGDVLLVQPTPASDLRVGDIVVVNDPAVPGRRLSHRIVELEPDGALITRGDANPQADSTPVPPQLVLGKVRGVLPVIGLIPAAWQHHPLATGTTVTLLAAGLALGSRGSARRDGPPRRLAGPLVAATAVVTGLTLTVSSTSAAFSKTTVNPSNSFSTAAVTLSDDDSATAMFTPTGLEPGDTGSKCLTVTYTGDTASSVALYVKPTDYSGTLGNYLAFTVEQGTGGSFAGGCGTFSPTAQLHSGTMSAFATAHSTFATGVGSFAPSANGQQVTYRFTYSVPADNAAQNLTSAIAFTWEARTP